MQITVKIDFKTKGEKRSFLFRKGSTHQEDRIILDF